MDGGGILGEKDGKVENVETGLKTSPRWVLHGAAMGRHVEFLKIIEAGTYRMHQRGLKKLGGCELPDEEALGTDGVQKKHLRKAGSRVKWQGWWPGPHRSKGAGVRDAERAGCRSPEERIWGRERREKKMKLRFSVSSVAATWRCLVRPVIAQRAGVPGGVRDQGLQRRPRSGSDCHRGACLSTVVRELSPPQFACPLNRISSSVPS